MMAYAKTRWFDKQECQKTSPLNESDTKLPIYLHSQLLPRPWRYSQTPRKAVAPGCQANAWNMQDPALRQLSIGSIDHKMFSKCPTHAPCSMDHAAAVSMALCKSCGVCGVPRQRAVTTTKRQALDCMYAQHKKSYETSKTFRDRLIYVNTRPMRQPAVLPTLPITYVPPLASPVKLSTEPVHLASIYSQFPERPVIHSAATVRKLNKVVMSVLRKHLRFRNPFVKSELPVGVIHELASIIGKDALLDGWSDLEPLQLEARILEMLLDDNGLVADVASREELIFASDALSSSYWSSSVLSGSELSYISSEQVVDNFQASVISQTNDALIDQFTYSKEASEVELDTMSNHDFKTKLLMGILDSLPIIQSRVIRIYLVSNFNDMKNERNRFLRYCTTELQTFCESYSLEFQLVDLRWGATEEMCSDSNIISVYCDEMSDSHKLSSGPFLAVLLGNSYGNIALPRTIDIKHFKILTDIEFVLKVPNGHLLTEWYRLDHNAIPPVYALQCEKFVLQPIQSQFEHFGHMFYTKHAEQLKRTAHRRWTVIEKQLRDVLDKLSLVAYDERLLSPIAAEYFSVSLLEMEVRCGMRIIRSSETPYLMVYAREISSIEIYLDERLAGKFVDVIELNNVRTIDHSKQSRLAVLKLIVSLLISNPIQNNRNCYVCCRVKFVGGSPQRGLIVSLEPPNVNGKSSNTGIMNQSLNCLAQSQMQESLEEMKATLMSKRRRNYTGEMWELPPEPEAVAEDAIAKAERRRLEFERAEQEQEGRVFEDPFYLQQYVINWDDNEEIRNDSVENGAFLTAVNELYLEKITSDFIHDCEELIMSYFFNKIDPAVADRLQEEIIHHMIVFMNRNQLNPAVAIPGTLSVSDIKLNSLVNTRLRSSYELNFLTAKSWRLNLLKTRLLKSVAFGCPFVLHGRPGSGRTSSVAAIIEMFRNWMSSPQAVIVARVLGSSPASITIEYVLSTMCHQICGAYGKPAPKDIYGYHSLRSYFQSTLDTVAPSLNASRRLVIIFDGIEQLSPSGHAHSLGWLPSSIPSYVTIVITTDTYSEQTMRNVSSYIERIAYRNQLDHRKLIDECILKIELLDEEEQKLMVNHLFRRQSRQLTPDQYEMVMATIGRNSYPLFISLLVKNVVTWTSETDPSSIKLTEDVSETFSKMLSEFESGLGVVFVSHALSYITVADGGLSEIELEDVLACDDDVLREVFYFIDPPLSGVIRVPQIYFALLRQKLGGFLVQCFDYGIPVFYWAHRQLADVVKSRYLCSFDNKGHSTFTPLYYHCNRTLADLFYENGNILKTLQLPMRHIVIKDVSRNVLPRPLVPKNRRKLQKLPLFLYRSAPESPTAIQEFKEKILCNTTWLLTKLQGRPYEETLNDFDLVKSKDSDIRLVEGILRAARFCPLNAFIFQLELLSRFSRDVGENSVVISNMVQTAWVVAMLSDNSLLLPLYTCVSPTATGVHRAKVGPTRILAVSVSWLYVEEALAVVWGSRYGLCVWQGSKRTNQLEPLDHLSSEVELNNVIVSRDARFAFELNKTSLIKWHLVTGRPEWEKDLTAQLATITQIGDGDDGDVDGDQEVTPVALTSDSSGLILLVSQFSKDLNQNVTSLVVMDTKEGLISGKIGPPLYGHGKILVECFQSSEFVIVTYTPPEKKVDISFHGEEFDASTVYVYNGVPSGECLRQFQLPSLRNHEIRSVLHGQLLLFACYEATIQHGDIVAVDVSDPKCKLMSITPPLLNTSTSPATEWLISFAVTDVGQLIAVYNTDSTSSAKIKLFIDGVFERKWHHEIPIKISLQASCLTVSKDQKFFYVGYKYFGVVKKFSLITYRIVCGLVVNSGDVISMFEVWPGIIYTSGSDCTVRGANMTSECKGHVTHLMMQPQQRSPKSADLTLYREISEGISEMNHIACAAGHHIQCKSPYSLMLSHVNKLSPLLVRVRDKLTVEKLESAAAANIAYVSSITTTCNNTLAIGLGVLAKSTITPLTSTVVLNSLNADFEFVTFNSTVLESIMKVQDFHSYLVEGSHAGLVVTSLAIAIWNMLTYKLIVPETPLYADLFCTDCHNIGLFRKRPNGCTMAVYDTRSHHYSHSFKSKYLSHAVRVLMTTNLHFMISVELEQVIIWRLNPLYGTLARDKYLSNTPNNDDDAEADETFYDDYDDDKRQDIERKVFVTTLSGMEMLRIKKYPLYRSRYLLKCKVTKKSVALVEHNILIVGTGRGQLLMFNLNVLSAAEPNVDDATESKAPQFVFCTVLHGVKHKGPVTVICMSSLPQERYIVCGSADHTLSVFDRQLNDRQATLIGHSDQVLSACVSTCDKYVVSGSADSSIRVWHLTTGNTLALFDACVDVFEVKMWEDDDCQPRVAALGDNHGRRKLMLFRTININSTCSRENF